MQRNVIVDYENTRLVKDFNKLTDKEKKDYIVGFKLGLGLSNMQNNKNVKYFINKILKYDSASIKNVDGDQNINESLINSFEKLLKECNIEDKKLLINSLESYIKVEKKYTESVERLNELKQIINKNIQLNQHKNIFDAQVKFVKLSEYYKKSLDNSYVELNTQIQTIKQNIDNQSKKSDTTIEPVVAPVVEPVVEPVVVEPVVEPVVVKPEVVEPVVEPVVVKPVVEPVVVKPEVVEPVVVKPVVEPVVVKPPPKKRGRKPKNKTLDLS